MNSRDVHGYTHKAQVVLRRSLHWLNGREETWIPGSLVAAIFVSIATLVGWLTGPWLPIPGVTLVYLLGVVVLAIRFGRGPALLCAVLSAVAYLALFDGAAGSAPSNNEVLPMLALLLVAFLTGGLTAQVRRQLLVIKSAADRDEQLHEFSRRVAGTLTSEDLAHGLCTFVARTPGYASALLLVDEQGLLNQVASWPVRRSPSVAEWSAARRLQSATHHRVSSIHLSEPTPARLSPLIGRSGVLGVLLAWDEAGAGFPPEARSLLAALCNQTAVALERMRYAARVEQAQIAAQTERLRSALLSSVSHDLRTPLVSIIGAATTLRDLDGQLAPGARAELLDAVLEESLRLNRFVQNLLDMTRIGYGGTASREEWVDLRDIAASAERGLRRLYPDRRVSIRIPDEASTLRTDPAMLERVLSNLLDNASKYGAPNTPVDIAARLEGQNLQLSVTDQGPGIPPALRERVFDMFFRVERRDEGPAGTGLGLAICRGLVAVLGGSIEIDNGPDGRGTTVRVKLPLERSKAMERAA